MMFLFDYWSFTFEKKYIFFFFSFSISSSTFSFIAHLSSLFHESICLCSLLIHSGVCILLDFILDSDLTGSALLSRICFFRPSQSLQGSHQETSHMKRNDWKPRALCQPVGQGQRTPLHTKAHTQRLFIQLPVLPEEDQRAGTEQVLWCLWSGSKIALLPYISLTPCKIKSTDTPTTASRRTVQCVLRY